MLLSKLKSKKMKKICFVVAIAGTADSFLRDHIHALAKEYEVYIAGNISSADEVARLEVKDFFRFDIHREISLVNDIKAVWQLYGYLKRMHFDAVHSVTPKAGLTAAYGIAAEYTGHTRFHYMVREAVCIVVDFLRGNL